MKYVPSYLSSRRSSWLPWHTKTLPVCANSAAATYLLVSADHHHLKVLPSGIGTNLSPN
jgi:hypothetical protein